MWCDKFDADLCRVVPRAREVIAPVAEVKLYTYGHTTEGKLNGPAVWHGYPTMLAFFGFSPETIGKPEQYYTDALVVECTFEEAMRDCWSHDYGIVIGGRIVWDSLALQTRFYDLMFHFRGQKVLTDERLRQVQGAVLSTVVRAVRDFGKIHQAYLWEATS